MEGQCFSILHICAVKAHFSPCTIARYYSAGFDGPYRHMCDRQMAEPLGGVAWWEGFKHWGLPVRGYSALPSLSCLVPGCLEMRKVASCTTCFPSDIVGCHRLKEPSHVILAGTYETTTRTKSVFFLSWLPWVFVSVIKSCLNLRSGLCKHIFVLIRE